MKNIVTISSQNGTCECTCCASTYDGTNSLYIETNVNNKSNPKLEVYLNDSLVQTIVLEANSNNLVAIGSEYFASNGVLKVRYCDDNYTGSFFTFDFPNSLAGNMIVRKAGDYSFNIHYATSSGGGSGEATTVSVKVNSTNTVATDEPARVVNVGDDVNVALDFYIPSGKDGEKGATGEKGVGVESTDVMYYKSTSSTELVGGEWLSDAPPWENGTYFWTKTVTTFDNGSTLESNPVCITGAQGETGAQGIQGVKGDTGAKGDKGDTGAQGAKGDKGDTGATGAKGDKGDTGATGKGISKITEYYQISTSNTTAPTSWQTTVPTMTATNKYLWNYETITYTDNTTSNTLKRVIGVYGDKGATGAQGATGATGATGAQGATGATGNGISSVTNYYLASTSSSGVTTSTSGWTTTIQTITTSKKYLWNYEVIKYTNGNSTTTTPVIIGVYGDKGATGATGPTGPTGATGATGKGVTVIVEQYYLSTSKTALAGGSWSLTPPTWTSGKYIWTRSAVTWTDNTTTYTTPQLANALNGANELATTAKQTADGKNVVFYQASQPSTSGRIKGDLWFDTDDGNKMYCFNGATWTASQYGSNAIASGAITTAHLVSNAVTADKIDVDDLFAQEITVEGSLKSADYNAETPKGMIVDMKNKKIDSYGDEQEQLYGSGEDYGWSAYQGKINWSSSASGTYGNAHTQVENGQVLVNNTTYKAGAVEVDGVKVLNFNPTNIYTPKVNTKQVCCNGDVVANNVIGAIVRDVSGNSLAGLKTSIDNLISSLTSGIKVDYFTLSASEYTPVTTSKVTHATLYGRKFSDYEYLNFELIVGTLIRASFSLPRRRFSTYSVELTYVDSTKTQYWVNVAFASDTSYYVQGSSNIASKTYVCITGMKALM